MLEIRFATADDVPAIAGIYNDAILHTTATFDTEIKSDEQMMQWFLNHDEKHPVLVADLEGTIAGWASLTKWSDRCAYEGTAEVSVYVEKNHRGKGLGKRLMEYLIREGEKAGLHYLLSRIVEGNDQSIHMHLAFGFSPVGTMHEIGFKFGRYLDVLMMERIFRKESEK